MAERHRKRVGYTLIELLVIMAIIATISALALPAFLSARLATNERAAGISMKTISTAETDFRSNDRDSNNMRDFWTGDLAGLYSMTNGATPGNLDSPIKLIEIAVATADSAPLADGAAGGEYIDVSKFGTIAPKAGYWLCVLDMDAAGEDYQRDTGGTPSMGAVHNFNHFGYITYPEAFGTSGRLVFIINETGVIYRRQSTVSIKPSIAVPPGAVTAAGYKDYPTDAELRLNWSKMD